MHGGGKTLQWALALVSAASVAAGAAFASGAVVNAQAPLSVPAARFYGRVSLPDGRPPANLTITAAVGNTVCSGTQSISGGQGQSGTDNSGNYAIDVQSTPGCTTPGSTVRFTASGGASGGFNAKETGTLPAIPGTAVHLDLTLQHPATPTRTATPAAPPAPPTVRATTAPPPPPPSTVAPRTPTRVPTVAHTPVAQHPVVQQAPKGPVHAQGPAKAPAAAHAPSKPASLGAGGAYQAPAVAPRLPNTGTGGLLDPSSSSPSAWSLMALILASLGLSATGLMAYRRSR